MDKEVCDGECSADGEATVGYVREGRLISGDLGFSGVTGREWP